MYDVATARDRDGDRVEDRSERVEDLLNGDRLGYGEGDPLAADSYQNYPTEPTQLSAPKWRDWVEALLSHPAVGSYDDAVAEATPTADKVSRNKWREAIQNAAGASQLDAGELFDLGDDGEQNATEDALSVLTEAWPDDAVRSDNPLVVANLYAGRGLSTAEIARLFDCSEDHVRGVLRQCGLLEGAENGTVDPTDVKDLRLGGTTVSNLDNVERSSSGGLSVDTRDFE
ncbi:hypothetical protein ACFQMA_11975 [Halosimplex aquaticum]|uniref:Sigma-70, region 4 n=1 Tax=Halosimplex aquaticum TaxID=3026162 RepID=A0ABD5Y466_9EURY|nr:hypothetical protein [Halosimplex aquaticum]